MTDPIADMLNRIKNAQAVASSTVDVPLSNFKYNIAKILEKSDFVEKAEKKSKRILEITLKYLPRSENSLLRGANKIPAISGVKRISKPGQRIYLDSRKIKKVKGGYGIAIISTSKGLMTDKEARKQKLGGEVLCEIW